MGNSALASTSSQRWQALQHIEAAFGQPDGNMFFTFNGHSYRGVGVNADGTMRVIDQTTGQSMTLDPVDVYSAGMAAAGTPLPAQTQSSQVGANGLAAGQQPSMFSNIMGQVGMYSGLLNMAAQIKQVKLFLNHIPQFSTILGGITAFLSAYSIFQTFQGLFKSGQISLMTMLNLGMTTFGLATGINAMILGIHSTFMETLTNPAGWYFAGAVISASILSGAVKNMISNGPSVKMALLGAASFVGTALFTNLGLMAAHLFGVTSAFGPIGWGVAAVVLLGNILWDLLHLPPPEQVAAQNLTQALNPVVWVQGPLAIVAVGTVAILMGWAKNTPAPAMSTLTVPAYYVNQVLAASGVGNVDTKSKTPTVLVEPGTGNVVIVSPNGTDSRGNPMVTLQSFALAKNLQFISSKDAPTDGAYIPFFQMINGKLQTKPSPQVTQALTLQDKMLQAILSGTLLTHDALNALNIAAAANKFGVAPGN